MSKLYHFCAMRQPAPNGPIGYYDGTFEGDVTSASYQETRRQIGALMKPPAPDGQGVVILSLTVLGDVPGDGPWRRVGPAT